MSTKEELLARLAECVVDMEDEDIVGVAEEYIACGYPALEGIMEGLIPGMNEVSQLYEDEEYFVTDVLLASDALYAALDILRPHLDADTRAEAKPRVVIGVVAGDTHDIGKNLVKIMMDTAGFEVYDLGRDVPLEAFADKAVEVDAQIICMSTLMTTTMDGMRRVIQMLEERGIRGRFKVMVGGSPVSKAFADSIGADCYTATAVEAARTAKALVGAE